MRATAVASVPFRNAGLVNVSSSVPKVLFGEATKPAEASVPTKSSTWRLSKPPSVVSSPRRAAKRCRRRGGGGDGEREGCDERLHGVPCHSDFRYSTKSFFSCAVRPSL